MTEPGSASTDEIRLTGLRAYGFHGVLPHEREHGQEFLVDACLCVDTGPAAATDDLTLTVDYGGLADRLAAVVTGAPVDLIETLADRLAQVCLADARVSGVEITVHKPSAPVHVLIKDVSVTIRRGRS